jgi:hypothetical protein
MASPMTTQWLRELAVCGAACVYGVCDSGHSRVKRLAVETHLSVADV